MDAAETYEQLVERFSSWARDRGDVRAAAVIGSRARSVKPADRWSDVDILVLATKPLRYLADGGWLQAIGDPWLTYAEPLPAGGGRGERRVVFRGALEVDLAILSARELRAARLVLPFVRRFPWLLPASLRAQLNSMTDVFARGMRVLVDKDRVLSRLASASPQVPAWAPPSADEFRDEVSRFWHGPVWTAKHLRRGEIWRAKDACDNRMKMPLLRMIEWNTRARRGAPGGHAMGGAGARGTRAGPRWAVRRPAPARCTPAALTQQAGRRPSRPGARPSR